MSLKYEWSRFLMEVVHDKDKLEDKQLRLLIRAFFAGALSAMTLANEGKELVELLDRSVLLSLDLDQFAYDEIWYKLAGIEEKLGYYPIGDINYSHKEK